MAPGGPDCSHLWSILGQPVLGFFVHITLTTPTSGQPLEFPSQSIVFSLTQSLKRQPREVKRTEEGETGTRAQFLALKPLGCVTFNS